MAGEPIQRSLAAHLRYSFRFRPGSRPDCIYGGVYQGIGVSYYSFGNRGELGNPVAVYLFQGARIARISPLVSFNYEWNFGLSFGWKPYDTNYNRANIMMGSRVNAYLNVDFYLNWLLTQRLELTTGLSMTHFSNGNTKFPNAGLNSIGMKLGLVYSFGRGDNPLSRPRARLLAKPFPRHLSYDLVLFGSWRRKGVAVGDKQYAAPDAYGVAGFNFAAMYNFGYKFRAGLSVDGVYDGSANVYTEDYIVGYDGGDPGTSSIPPRSTSRSHWEFQGRAEFVMPYFTVGFGLGFNVLHKGGDLKSFYQMLTLKVGVTRNTFVHVGYCLKGFPNPELPDAGRRVPLQQQIPEAAIKLRCHKRVKHRTMPPVFSGSIAAFQAGKGLFRPLAAQSPYRRGKKRARMHEQHGRPLPGAGQAESAQTEIGERPAI